MIILKILPELLFNFIANSRAHVRRYTLRAFITQNQIQFREYFEYCFFAFQKLLAAVFARSEGLQEQQSNLVKLFLRSRLCCIVRFSGLPRRPKVSSQRRFLINSLNNFILVFFALFAQQSMAIEISAKHAVLMDYDTKEVLYEKDAHIQTAPSSMSKLMTTYIIFEKLKNGEIKIDDEVTVSEAAWLKGGSRMFIEVGTKVKMSDLLLGMIVQSGNDATIAIAEACAGSESAFAELMNAKAKDLGLKSNFVNATGWPDEYHLMSVYDIAILSKRLIEDFPEYYHYFSQKEFLYNNIKQYNRNSLLYDENSFVDGLKTGRTDAAGYGVAASSKARDGDRRLIAVVNGCDSNSIRERDAKELLTYGLHSFVNIQVAKSGDILANVSLHDGADKVIPLKAHSDFLYTVKKINSSKINVKLLYKKPIIAPVKQGEVVGNLIIDGVRNDPIMLELRADKDYNSASFLTKFLRKFSF